MAKLKQLESFVSVVARGSLTAAALAEGVAPAIMGRRLDALEERLGVKLLGSTTRRIALTHEGRASLEDCQRLGRRREGQRPPAHHCAGRFWPPSCGAAGGEIPRAA